MTLKSILFRPISCIPDLAYGLQEWGPEYKVSSTASENMALLKANLDGLVITAGYYTQLLIWMCERQIINSTNMSINLDIHRICIKTLSNVK